VLLPGMAHFCSHVPCTPVSWARLHTVNRSGQLTHLDQLLHSRRSGALVGPRWDKVLYGEALHIMCCMVRLFEALIALLTYDMAKKRIADADLYSGSFSVSGWCCLGVGRCQQVHVIP
jgi:hypothetical protein